MGLLERLFGGDGGKHIHDLIVRSGEPWTEGLKLFKAAYEARKGSPALASDLWALQAERAVYAKEALEHWRATAALIGTGRPVDGVISPVTPWAASPR
jgi:amidase